MHDTTLRNIEFQTLSPAPNMLQNNLVRQSGKQDNQLQTTYTQWMGPVPRQIIYIEQYTLPAPYSDASFLYLVSQWTSDLFNVLIPKDDALFVSLISSMYQHPRRYINCTSGPLDVPTPACNYFSL